MRVTREWLTKHMACAEQVAVFSAEWPDGAEVTAETVARARKLGLTVVWLATRWLCVPALIEYDRVRDAAGAEYNRVRASALIEYDRVRDAAWAEYNRVCHAGRVEYEHVRTLARAEYERVRVAAQADYDRVRDAAWAEYNRVTDAAFVRLATK